ncbi:F-box domain-containing protein [Mycena indigotica]|uniref:F-box domain-containing protein n=1 Tax=Mycena indigotica TaxID=2126181 RepID=A0A8H6SGV0_9AGAR|nr:F-box domain-containing protein [Mycena indigotica]KAF7298560.1 F-box domain-containing protein [Mycena indigotica]
MINGSLSTVIYPVNTLPAEILCKIFAFAVSSSLGNDITRTLLLITSVCQRWRQVAIADPRLWTNVGYFVRRFDRNEPDWLLRHFLSRALGHPIRLALSFAAAYSRVNVLPHHFFSSARQWMEADITGPSNEGWAFHPSDLPLASALDLPHLEKLSLDVRIHVGVPPRPMFQNAPRLRELSIRQPLHILQLSFPVYQLRKLTILHGSNTAACSHIISVLPKLIALEDLTLPSLIDDMSHESPTPFPMHRLETLALFGCSSIVLPHLSMPSVTSLQLSELSTYIALRSLDSLPGIVSVSLVGSRPSTFGVVLNTAMFTPVKHLTVDAFPMAPPNATQCATDLGTLLPNLESFTVRIPPSMTSASSRSVLRPFIDGIVMRANIARAAGVTAMKLTHFIADFAPLTVQPVLFPEDTRDLKHLQQTTNIQISMPNGYPARKRWRLQAGNSNEEHTEELIQEVNSKNPLVIG